MKRLNHDQMVRHARWIRAARRRYRRQLELLARMRWVR